jgi:hypothetical protein
MEMQSNIPRLDRETVENYDEIYRFGRYISRCAQVECVMVGQTTNQPTKELTKVAVLRKRSADHFWVRTALVATINGGLNRNGGLCLR